MAQENDGDGDSSSSSASSVTSNNLVGDLSLSSSSLAPSKRKRKRALKNEDKYKEQFQTKHPMRYNDDDRNLDSGKGARKKQQRLHIGEPPPDERFVPWGEIADAGWGSTTLIQNLHMNEISELIQWATRMNNDEADSQENSFNPLAGLSMKTSNVPLRPVFLRYIHDTAYNQAGARVRSMFKSNTTGNHVRLKRVEWSKTLDGKHFLDKGNRLQRAFDATALVAIGMLFEEIMTASLMPLAQEHVNRCRELEIEEQEVERNPSDSSLASDAMKTQKEMYENHSSIQWTLPPEEAIVKLISTSKPPKESEYGIFGLPTAFPPTRIDTSQESLATSKGKLTRRSKKKSTKPGKAEKREERKANGKSKPQEASMQAWCDSRKYPDFVRNRKLPPPAEDLIISKHDYDNEMYRLLLPSEPVPRKEHLDVIVDAPTSSADLGLVYKKKFTTHFKPKPLIESNDRNTEMTKTKTAYKGRRISVVEVPSPELASPEESSDLSSTANINTSPQRRIPTTIGGSKVGEVSNPAGESIPVITSNQQYDRLLKALQAVPFPSRQLGGSSSCQPSQPDLDNSPNPKDSTASASTNPDQHTSTSASSAAETEERKKRSRPSPESTVATGGTKNPVAAQQQPPSLSSTVATGGNKNPPVAQQRASSPASTVATEGTKNALQRAPPPASTVARGGTLNPPATQERPPSPASTVATTES